MIPVDRVCCRVGCHRFRNGVRVSQPAGEGNYGSSKLKSENIIVRITVEPTKATQRGKVNCRHLFHQGSNNKLQLYQLTVHFIPLASVCLPTIT